MGALRPVDGEEGLDFAEDALERPRLVAVEGDGVAVHRVAGPHHRPPLALDGADELGQVGRDLVGTEAADEREPPRLVVGAQQVDQPDEVVRLQRRAAFQPDRVLDAAGELDMGVVGLARPVADPDHVAGGRVPVPAGRIDAGHRLLEAEEQRLVAGIDVGRPHLRVRFRVDAAGAHEVERLGDADRQLLVAVRLRAVLDEAEHPAVGVLEIGVAAGREGTQEVEGRGRLAIGHLDAVGVGGARGLVELDAVDDVAAVARQLDFALALDSGGARLGELAGDAADLGDRHRPGKGQDHRHLQEDAEEVADVVGVVLGEALGAVAALEEEPLAGRDPGEPLLELPRLAGKDQRRIGGDAGLDRGERRRVGIDRRLLDRPRAPALWGPALLHHAKLRTRKNRGGLYTASLDFATRVAPRGVAPHPIPAGGLSLRRPSPRRRRQGARRPDHGGGARPASSS